MPKFTFTCEHSMPGQDDSVAKITYESNRETLEDIVEDFEDFLRGCGYYLPSDDVIINTSTDTYQHNDFFYDINRNR